jgi:hypothetical protein
MLRLTKETKFIFLCIKAKLVLLKNKELYHQKGKRIRNLNMPKSILPSNFDGSTLYEHGYKSYYPYKYL